MIFEFESCFYLSEEDEKEILELIKKGMPLERAVTEWSYGLDDCDYYRESEVEDQIISYIETKI